MNRYYSLYKYFIELKIDEINISFEEIEKILCIELPSSAYKFRT
jgi:hypothetical protein